MERSATACPHCSKTFCNGSAKNRHIRQVHLMEAEVKTKNNHIFCPLCSDNKKPILTYALLIEHLTNFHNAIIEEETLTFSNYEEFSTWRTLEERNVNYVKQRVLQCSDKKVLYFHCTRSDSYGFKSVSTGKRMMKKGGTIKINGICPSRIIAHCSNNGQVVVNFVKTHAGHKEDDLRSQRLTKAQKEELCDKLKAGVSKERIIKDAREVKGKALKRINILNRQDLTNIATTFNIENKRDPHDIVAVSIKVEEKEIGEEDNEEVSKEKLKLNQASAEKCETVNNVNEGKIENVNFEILRKITRERARDMFDNIFDNDNIDEANYTKAISEILPILKRHSEGNCSKRKKMDK